MRAIFVNHCHPDCPHVCGTRAREFAAALARQGHRIVLLTETLHRTDPAFDPMLLPTALGAHDWRTPFCLAVRPRPSPILEALRAGRLPAFLRAAVITYQYLVPGGMFTDWRAASRSYWHPLAEVFQPDVVWGVFGNTDAWAIARGLAQAAGCPWVRDLKDQWTAFIPAPFRMSLSRRYADASAVTALSAANAADAAPWIPGPASVVYSGLPADLLAAVPPAVNISFTVVLVGAVYETGHLAALMEGLRRFAGTPGRSKPVFVYVGTDVEIVTKAAVRLAGVVDVDIRGQLPFRDYWRVICGADLNLYIRTTRTGWWHHKIVELLGARRPILCVPGDIDEAHSLARQAKGRLLGAVDPAAVAAVLDRVEAERGLASAPVEDSEDLHRLTWDRQSEELLAALRAAAADD